MSIEQDNKAIVGRWFTSFWGETCDLSIVDEIAAPDMLLHYSLHEPRRGHEDIKAFMTDFRKAFPDLNFWGAADLIAEPVETLLLGQHVEIGVGVDVFPHGSADHVQHSRRHVCRAAFDIEA